MEVPVFIISLSSSASRAAIVALSLYRQTVRSCLYSQTGNGASLNPSVSADGRYVAFESAATNLVVGDTNGVRDIFVVDRDADGDYSFYSDPETCSPGPSKITRVSIAGDGEQANNHSREAAISGNGAFVAFTSSATNLVIGDTNGIDDVFVHFIDSH